MNDWNIANSLFRSCITLLTVLTLGGCATARPAQNNRKGFFDQFARNHRSSSSLKRQPERQPIFKITNSVQFQWPLQRFEVTSPFGKRGRQFHEGIDLRAKSGTKVYSAQAGKVIYSSSKIRGYGKMIVIRHRDGISTVYAHNSRLYVQTGQKVKKGQLIAMSGSTGRTTGPHLHFEVRNGTEAIDPLQLFPKPSKQPARLVSAPSPARITASK